MSDLIKRHDAIGKIKDWMKFIGYSHSERNVMECTIQMLEELPSEQKTGKWTIEDCHAATYKYCCSECNAHHRARYDFCPTCGTRMECEEE